MVLISFEHEFIYVKTSRTAGTSTEVALQPVALGHINCLSVGGLDEVLHGTEEIRNDRGIVGYRGNRRPETCVFHSHMCPSDIVRVIGLTTWTTFTKVANIRNPWSRMVSLFHFRARRARLYEIDDPRTISFEEFVQSSHRTKVDLEITSGNYGVDRFLRFEFLKSDLGELCSELRIHDVSTSLPALKVGIWSGRDDYRSFYSTKSRKKIERDWGDWIEIGKYTY